MSSRVKDTSSSEYLPIGACLPLSRYRSFERIGEGTYGLVYRAVDRESNTMVALKRIILHNEEDEGFPLTTLREISALRDCGGHSSIVAMIGVAAGRTRSDVYLVFEYCEHDLAVLLKSAPPFSESEIKCLIFQLSCALKHMHDRHIVHRDIKPSNLLYNSCGQLKVADFGSARRLSPRSSSQLTVKVVTLWYRCPDILLGASSYSFPTDVWSLGCVMGELVLKRPLLPGRNETDQFQCVCELLGCPTLSSWPDISLMPLYSLLDMEELKRKCRYNNLSSLVSPLSREGLTFLDDCLQFDPLIRLTASEACRHKYFDASPRPKESDLMPTFPSTHSSRRDDKRTICSSGGTKRKSRRKDGMNDQC